MNLPGRTDELALSLVSSAFVGVFVALATRRSALVNCPRSVPPDAYGIVELGVRTAHLDWAGCRVLVPLAPTYVGLLGVLALAAWTVR